MSRPDAETASHAHGKPSNGGDAGSKGDRPQQAPAGGASLRQLRSAEVDFAVTLLSLLQPYLDLRQGATAAGGSSAAGEQEVLAPTKGAEKGQKRRRAAADLAAASGGSGVHAGPAAWCAAAHAAGGLLDAVRTTGAYAPTEDVTGLQRAFLGEVAAAAVGSYRHLADGRVAEAEAGCDVEGAAASVVCAMLDLEHRALQAHAADLYSLVWAAASQHRGGSSSGSSAAAAPSADAPSAAARIVVGMVRAAGELRQLDTALTQLVEAAVAHCADSAAAAAAAQGGKPSTSKRKGARGEVGGGGAVPVPAAAWLLGDPAVLAAVRAAVGQAPPGQAPAIIGVVKHCLPALLRLADGLPTPSAPTAEALRPLSQLLAACLYGLRLDLTVSSPTAAAARRLLTDCLGPLLHVELAAAGGAGGVAGGAEGLRLLLLLRLYASVVR